MIHWSFIKVSGELDSAGLVWQPEIGDEVSFREDRKKISILVDPFGMTVSELRKLYLWLPSIEQMIHQFEARQAILFHSGLELDSGDLLYKTVVRAKEGIIKSTAKSMRLSVGCALRDLLTGKVEKDIVN